MTATAPAAQRKGHGRAEALAAVARDARLTRGYLMQMGLATAIATLGLLMDSSPVIIGAMLISPLLGPIMGFGFAIATFDGRLLRRSLQTLGAGVIVGIAVVLTLEVDDGVVQGALALEPARGAGAAGMAGERRPGRRG